MSNFIEIIEDEEGIDVGDVRAIDYADAVVWGLEPENYEYGISEGIHIMKLIFKTWGKRNSLNCFFQAISDRKCYRITFFTNKNNQYRYSAGDRIIDFSEPGILENVYELTISRTKNNHPKVEKAILISNST